MSSLWWLQEGWTSAVCPCGRNIWDSGGDPDHGLCYDCWWSRHEEQQPCPPQPYPEEVPDEE